MDGESCRLRHALIISYPAEQILQISNWANCPDTLTQKHLAKSYSKFCAREVSEKPRRQRSRRSLSRRSRSRSQRRRLHSMRRSDRRINSSKEISPRSYAAELRSHSQITVPAGGQGRGRTTSTRAMKTQIEKRHAKQEENCIDKQKQGEISNRQRRLRVTQRTVHPPTNPSERLANNKKSRERLAIDNVDCGLRKDM